MSTRHFEQARKTVDLASFVIANIGDGKMIGGYLRWGTCPLCGASKKPGSRKLAVRGAHWTCFSCLEGGSVVDFAAAYWEVTPDEAAKKLINEDTIPKTRVIAEAPSVEEDKARQELCGQIAGELKEVICSTPNEDVFRYLEDVRGISRAVLVEGMKRKIFGCLPSNPQDAFKLLRDVVGEDRLKRSGIWREGSKMPAIAFRPLVFFLHSGGAEFRIIREPKESESKTIRYGLLESPIFWKGDSKELEVVEGGIDLLSRIEMGSVRNIIAVPGCNSWRIEWFTKLHQRGWADRVVVMLDNDVDRPHKNPGQEWAGIMMSKLTELGIQSHNDSPASGDVNDMLLKMRHLNPIAH